MLIATKGGGLKNRAFTLIELLAVIIVIGVIALIATPVIIGVINKTERQAFERSIDGLLETVRLDYSTDSFVSPREYYYEGKDLILLTVAEETKDESVGMKGRIEGKGFIYIDGEGVIHIENICSKKYCANGEENKIEFTENESGVIPEVGKNDPIIRLIGEKTVYVNLNEVYEELGAVAKTKSGKELEYTKEITIPATGETVSEIDTSIENTYVITYKTENEGKEVSVSRNVVVLDMKPFIGIPEGSPDYVQKQEVMIWASAKVSPNKITSFIIEIKKDREVMETKTVTEPNITIILSETGEYEVKVTVTDSNNRTSTVSRTYKIDSTPPEIRFIREITLNANDVSGFDLLKDETVEVTDNTDEEPTWRVEGNLNALEKESTITYIAEDKVGNERRVDRTFQIEPAVGPLLGRSSESSNNIWLGKAQKIMLYATITIENDELTSFSYQVDDEPEINVPITEAGKKRMEKEVILDTTGKHTIKVRAVGKYNNESESVEPLGEYWIDLEAPTIGEIRENTDTWSADKTLTATLTDNESKIMYYALIRNDATKPAENSSEWQSVGETPTSPYNFSKTVTENGTYYVWAKDEAGNTTSKTVVVNKIDEKVPVLTVNNYSGKYGADKPLSTLFAFGEMGGTVTCKDGEQEITNIKDITLADDHTITCIGNGNNGKNSMNKTITLSFESKTFDEIMTTSNPDIGTNDPGNNKRYIGTNPNNYVTFNGEKWRIIGLFNGQAKIILGKNFYGSGNMAWDTNNSNDWSNASAMRELNNLYFSDILEVSRKYIDNTHKWKLGSASTAALTREAFYNIERTGKEWTGPIGLPIPSDYAYATTGGSVCNTTTLNNWDIQECSRKSWLVSTAYVHYWTLDTLSGDNTKVIYYNDTGRTVSSDASWGTYGGPTMRPVVYLKTNVKIKGGTGTSDDPYILGI